MDVNIGRRIITRLKHGGLYGSTISKVLSFSEGQVYYRMRKYGLTVSRKHARGESPQAQQLIARCTQLIREAKQIKKQSRELVYR